MPITFRRLAMPLAATASLLVALPVLAQGTPPISTMPPPPSASDPAPKEGAARKAQQPRKTRAAAPKSDTDEITIGEPATGKATRGRAASGTSSSYQRPQRYVPEEFDRDRRQGGSGIEPTMSSSGRPGMGMKF